MALVEVGKKLETVSFVQLERSVENEFRTLLKAFYGDAYKDVLTKGKLAGDIKISEVVHIINMIEL